MSVNLDDSKICILLKSIKSIAIVGAKDKPGQPVDRVGRYLINAGYEVIPVHPTRAEVWGRPAFKSVNDLPQGPDAVVLFRAPEHCAEHAKECLKLTPLPQVFWMQQGITNQEAQELMEKAGVYVVQDACILVEHQRLL